MKFFKKNTIHSSINMKLTQAQKTSNENEKVDNIRHKRKKGNPSSGSENYWEHPIYVKKYKEGILQTRVMIFQQ